MKRRARGLLLGMSPDHAARFALLGVLAVTGCTSERAQERPPVATVPMPTQPPPVAPSSSSTEATAPPPAASTAAQDEAAPDPTAGTSATASALTDSVSAPPTVSSL